MQRRAASALAAGVLVAIGCASSEAATTGTTEAAACPTGTLATSYEGKQRCLGIAARKRIYAGLTRMRDRGIAEPATYRRTASTFRVAVATVRRIDREGRQRGWPLPPAPRLAASTAILSPGGAGAAADLRADVECSGLAPGLAVASLRWAPAAERGLQQRVAVSLFEDGFERGDFETSAALSVDRSVMEWSRVHGRAFHFWRVLTLHDDGWHPSPTFRFEGVACIFDQRQP